MDEEKEVTMTVKEFLKFTSTNSKLILKDEYNGKEFTCINKYLDRVVTGCYSKLSVSKHSDYYCNAVLVAWIKHKFEKDELR